MNHIFNWILTVPFTDEPAAKTELARLRAMDKERERKLNQKLKGWLSCHASSNSSS